MDQLPSIVTDLALILVVAGIVTILFRRLKQPLVLGYIVAGFLTGPHTTIIPTVSDSQNIHLWANLGVIFLMFSLGLEFSFKKILKMGSGPIIAAVSIIGFMSLLGYEAGHLFGWSRINNLFLGGMLAMSSTTIIYKAFDDMGLRQQRFAEPVLSVLVLEDILGILLMVILSTLAVRNSINGITLMDSLVRLLFYLVLLLIVGIFVIPSLLRKNRQWISQETLLIVSLGLCFVMVVVAVKLGYSSAFGAFMMGSILAETIEADSINRVVDPVKNLFGAIFFVSVGMLVNPAILVQYWLPILALTLTILFGQAIFGSFSYLISGQPLKVAMQCGFSMAQIGEFAFIIASLGESLGVISNFLYPIVVAVSVITTFLTPYMIRLAVPAYNVIDKHLPTSLRVRFDHEPSPRPNAAKKTSVWKTLLSALGEQVLVYSILSVAVIAISLNFVLPLFRHLLTHWPGNIVVGLITIAVVAPFLRAMCMRKNHSVEMKTLWLRGKWAKLGVGSLFVARYVWCTALVYYVINFLSPYPSWLHLILAAAILCLILMSRRIKAISIRIERTFRQNLGARNLQAQIGGKVKPLYATHLLSRDIHIAELEVPESSRWVGHTLNELHFGSKDGIMVVSILRGRIRKNIPGGNAEIYPGDHLQVIGGDEQLQKFAQKMKTEIYEPAVDNPEQHVMDLRCLSVNANSPFVGKTISESGIRDKYRCMIVGFEEGKEALGLPVANRKFCEGDLVWVVGERESLAKLIAENLAK